MKFLERKIDYNTLYFYNDKTIIFYYDIYVRIYVFVYVKVCGLIIYIGSLHIR